MTPAEIKRLQKCCGKFLWYARTCDPTMEHMLNSLASEQAKGTTKTLEELQHFLDYCATHPDAEIRYTASNMILKVHSDASYLSESNGRSRYGGYHYLGNNNNDDINAPFLILAKILKHVVSSAAESELAGMFHNAKAATPSRITLEELGHLQPPTPLQTDNTTALGIVNKTTKH